MSDIIFPRYPPPSWQAAGKPAIFFPIEDIQESGGNRLVAHERPYRDGAKHDDTGSRAKRWTLTCTFTNGLEEDGIDGTALYPDVLNALSESFDVHETGTLVLPTRGAVRCRAESYDRDETFAERDSATVRFVFVQDNEDDVTAASFTAPSARSVAVSRATETVFSLEASGVYDDNVASLQEFAAGLEALAAAPGQFIDDIEGQGKRFQNACNRIEVAFSTAESRAISEQQALLLDPANSLPGRQLRQLRDVAARATADRLSALPRIVSRTFKREVSLIAIAPQFKQELDTLLDLNRRYPNPLAIPAGKPVRMIDA